MLAAKSRLFTSFITCAWPGCSPSTKTRLPIRRSKGRSVLTAAGAPAAIIASVPARAPAWPPLIGESTMLTPRAPGRGDALHGARPMVDISGMDAHGLPWMMPPGAESPRPR